MKITVRLANGQLSIGVEGGTFEQARQIIEAATAALSAAGIELAPESDIEQHRHDPEPVSVSNLQ